MDRDKIAAQLSEKVKSISQQMGIEVTKCVIDPYTKSNHVLINLELINLAGNKTELIIGESNELPLIVLDQNIDRANTIIQTNIRRKAGAPIRATKNKNPVDHPPHYGGEDNPYEAIKVIEAWGSGFCIGNVIKYVSRAGKKDPDRELEDLKKASWYLNREIEKLEGDLNE